ncbi:uncharacterized protein LOC127707340 isoform X2 [Mytilus californianus]|uniref:uncharacterized protein LOC127707340 isoform X2 n=1 Tax=Mytilus californianus TaxID=6549 RepID=UPI0022482B09|nr:uncharacterized protein LOC127707340 isoform X2 [Mytilus californianus]
MLETPYRRGFSFVQHRSGNAMLETPYRRGLSFGKPKSHGGSDKEFIDPLAYCTGTTDIEDGVDTLVIDDSKSELQTAQSKASQSLVENWIFLKENSNATTWKKQFLEHKLLCEKDVETLGAKMKRSELAEWLLMKTLQKVKTKEDIELIETVVCSDVGILPRRGKTEQAFWQESKEKLTEVKNKLEKNLSKLEELLSREDAIAVKDHLVQDKIINLTDNEHLLRQEKRVHDGKSSLIKEVIIMVINKLHLGSYQCLTQSLEAMSNTKRQEQIDKILTDVSEAVSVQSGLQPIEIEHMQSKFYDKPIDDNTDFKLTMRATNKTEQEVEEVYRPIENNLKTLKRIFLSRFASTPVKISKGSLVINFQMMERNMQEYIKECLRNGHVSTLIKMIFNEIAIEDVVPSGEILLHVQIEVNKDLDLPEPISENLSEKKFVPDNRSFLIEEIDTDAIHEGLRKRDISIPSIVFSKGRREKATQIIDYILVNHHEDTFLLLIKDNEENEFDYLLQRLETYETVYTTDPSCLRTNILLQFSKIVDDIDIDDIRDILLERRTVITEKILNGRQICMTTLLVKILKYGDAIRAFVDALFIIDWPAAEKLITRQSQVSVVAKGSGIEICESSSGDNLLFEGSFKIIIDKRVSTITIGDKVRIKPSVTPLSCGEVTQRSIGKVAAIFSDDHTVAIDFPEHQHCIRILEEIQIVLSTHPGVGCDGCNLFPLVGNRYKCWLCEKFNFCEICFRIRKHRHPFTKIEEPTIYPDDDDVNIHVREHIDLNFIIDEMSIPRRTFTCDEIDRFPFIGNIYKCRAYKIRGFCENCLRNKKHRHPFTRIGEAGSTIEIGDDVRIKQSVTTPEYRWRGVTQRSIGTVRAIYPNGNIVTIDFPEHHNWKGSIEEIEIVPSTHPGVGCDGCYIFPLVGNRYKCRVCTNFNFCEICFRSRKQNGSPLRVMPPGTLPYRLEGVTPRGRVN